MLIKCVKELDGFTVGRWYKLRGCIADYLEVHDDNGELVIVLETYFEN